MSDEHVTKLRLKPRLVGDAPAPAAAASPAPAPPPAPAVDEAAAQAAIRLKPRLTAPAAAAAAPPVESSAEAPAEAPPPAAPLAAASAPPFPPPPGAPGAAGAAVPSAATEEEDVVPAPDFIPDHAAEPGEVTAMRAASLAPFAPPGFPPPPGADRVATPAIPPVEAAGKRRLVFGLAGLAVLGLAAGGYFYLMREEPPPPPPPRRPPPAAPAPPPVAGAPAAAPAQPRTTVTPTDAARAPHAAATPAKPVPVTPPATPPPSAAFRSWVQNLRISSVRTGPPARIFIGSTTFIEGDLVEPELGVVFEAYNAETRQFTFRDRSGATIERRL